MNTPLRMWPGVLAVTLQWLLVGGVFLFAPEHTGTAVIAGILFALLVVLWWLFFSRARWLERLGALALMAAALAVTLRLVHPSIANGMMGFMLYIYAAPLLCLALVAAAAATRSASMAVRFAALAAAIVLACGTLTLARTNGLTGEARSDFEWRWTPTAEEQLLARNEVVTPPAPVAPTAPPQSSTAAPMTGEAVTITAETATPAPAWPGFRGSERSGIVRGVRIATDWTQNPPVELWRRKIGPGWSSFAVAGDRLFTQEQRGEEEIVSAYDLKTGAPVWIHRDAARFWESNAGPGPRGTPTFSDGRIYTHGATGILNALNARDGSSVWSHNTASDTRTTVPDWGIASSPLVVGDIVVAAAAGSLAAYDAASGKPRWFGPAQGGGYSSPHLATIDGVTQIVMVSGRGVIGVSPSDGKALWQHQWGGDSIVQPVLLEDGDLLVGSGSGLAANSGVLRIHVAHENGAWKVTERWTSTGLKPYFNDFVAHQGYGFGFDGSILACIDLNDGARKWKGGRYGHGQLVLLPDQNLLLVLSEDGELALVSASPDRFTEIARVPALEGKTWNHPVLVGNTLLVRNGEEMAAFRLTPADR